MGFWGRAQFRIGLGLGGILLTSACASRQMRVLSEPAGARVLAPSGKELSLTPGSVALETLLQESGGEDLLILSFEKADRQVVSVLVPLDGTDEVMVKLPEEGAETFRSLVLQRYARPVHDLIAQTLVAQGALLRSQLAAAETTIDRLQKDFPTLAMPLVLRADLELARGRRPDAINLLKKALALQPADARIQASLQRLEAKGGP
jgi:hypothetical protein